MDLFNRCNHHRKQKHPIALIFIRKKQSCLTAGLFFDPISGIIAGLIGGTERYIIGTYFGIGSYTRVACSCATVVAGILNGFLDNSVKVNLPGGTLKIDRSGKFSDTEHDVYMTVRADYSFIGEVFIK